MVGTWPLCPCPAGVLLVARGAERVGQAHALCRTLGTISRKPPAVLVGLPRLGASWWPESSSPGLTTALGGGGVRWDLPPNRPSMEILGLGEAEEPGAVPRSTHLGEHGPGDLPGVTPRAPVATVWAINTLGCPQGHLVQVAGLQPEIGPWVAQSDSSLQAIGLG